MEKKKYLLGYYDYTVVLTYLGMLMGFLGITLVMEMRYKDAIICLMIAGVCDMFDGAVASTKMRNRKEKNFGIQIDSLSDLISFGVLPALFVYQFNHKSYLSFAVAGVYTLCALIRLAYFNVCEEERQRVEDTARKYYQGLPVTTVVLLLPAIFLISVKFSFQLAPFVLLWLLVVTAFLFLCPVKIKKPKLLGKVGIAMMGVLELLLLLMGILGDI